MNHSQHMTSLRTAFAVAFALSLVAGAPAAAQSDSVFSGFQKISEYILEVDGAQDETAEIYFQQRIPAYLVITDKLTSPAMLMPRTKQVQSVSLLKIKKRGAEIVDLSADAVFATKGTFELNGAEIAFAADDHNFVVKERPPLLGLMRASGLENFASSYSELADAYQPSKDAIETLKAETREMRVRVYFGSWCPFCGRYVPRIIKVDRELKGTNVKIDYYGLPKNFDDDKEVVDAMKLTGVPTGVVFIGGREAGRIRSDQWKTPEQALAKIATATK